MNGVIVHPSKLIVNNCSPPQGGFVIIRGFNIKGGRLRISDKPQTISLAVLTKVKTAVDFVLEASWNPAHGHTTQNELRSSSTEPNLPLFPRAMRYLISSAAYIALYDVRTLHTKRQVVAPRINKCMCQYDWHMQTYTYIHYIHTCTHACTHARTHARTHACMHACMRVVEIACL